MPGERGSQVSLTSAVDQQLLQHATAGSESALIEPEVPKLAGALLIDTRTPRQRHEQGALPGLS
jgi:hypothetical protein